MMLERAERAGAQIEKARVLEISRARGIGWRLRTSGGVLDADFCIVATGARNPLRDVGTELTAAGHHVRAGLLRARRPGADRYPVPAAPGRLHLGFPALRPPLGGHLRQGRAGRVAAQAPGALHGAARPVLQRARPFTAICCRRSKRAAWKKNRVAGEGWMAVGDAAGLVDPITGEGLYYALRSADLAARRCWPNWAAWPRGCTPTAACCATISPPTWNSARAWPSASSWADFLFGSVPARMVQFTRRSPRFSGVMQDLFAGKQPYLGLKHRLLRNLNGSLYEIAMSLGFSRLVPGKAQP